MTKDFRETRNEEINKQLTILKVEYQKLTKQINLLILEQNFLQSMKDLERYEKGEIEISLLNDEKDSSIGNEGEEDLFSDARNEAGKINRKDLTKRIKEASDEELRVLEKYIKLLDTEKETKDKISVLEIELDKKVLSQYSKLSENEIKTLVVEDKWLLSLHNSVKSEMERVSHKLAGRIKELGDRYDVPLPKLTAEVQELSKKVDKHLEKMGFKW